MKDNRNMLDELAALDTYDMESSNDWYAYHMERQVKVSPDKLIEASKRGLVGDYVLLDDIIKLLQNHGLI